MNIEAKNAVVADVKIVDQREIEKHKKHVGSTRLHPGHKLFSLELATLEVKEVQPEKEYDYKTKTTRAKVNIKEGFLYQPALNQKNAMRKFSKAVAHKLGLS